MTRSGSGVPSLRDGRLAGVLRVPVEADPGRLEDADVASASSGPMPSPGIRVTAHATWSAPVRAGQSAGVHTQCRTETLRRSESA